MTDWALLRRNVGKLELPVGRELALNFACVDVQDGVGAVDTAHVDLKGSGADSLVGVVKEGGEQVDAGGEGGGVGEGGLVLGDEEVPELGLAVLKAGDLGLTDDGAGRERHLAVVLGLELSEALDGGHEVVRHRPDSEAVSESLNLAQHGKNKLVPHRELLVGHVQVDDDVKVILVGLVQGLDDVVEQKAVELGLDGEVILDGPRDERRCGAEVVEGVKGASGSLLNVLGETSQGVFDTLDATVQDLDIVDVELPVKGDNLLDLGGVLEGEGGEQVTGGDDGARGHVVSDGSGFTGLQRHDHLHGLNLNVGLSSLDLSPRLLQVPDDLAGDVRAELGGVEDGGHEDGDAVEREAETERLVHGDDPVRDAAEVGDEGAVGVLPDLDLDVLSVDLQVHEVGGKPRHRERVLGVKVSDLNGEGVHVRDLTEGDLTLGQRSLELSRDLVDVLEGLVNGCGGHDQVGGLGNADALLLDEAVKPGRVDGVLLELVRLKELDEVLYRGADLSTDLDLLESEDEGLPRVLAGGPLGEKVPELGVGELVDASVGADGEVAPDV
mmetsp:Transcript_27075/g.54017  ORF Transcript_27075/g.54017 Transcript_27075/m.54017 type:complete len:554 (-) Transcript_27075:281-1942(-)